MVTALAVAALFERWNSGGQMPPLPAPESVLSRRDASPPPSIPALGRRVQEYRKELHGSAEPIVNALRDVLISTTS